MAKAKEVLARVDALLPNGYTEAEKLGWLAQAEGFVLREIRGAEGALPEMAKETELTAEIPYDEMYRFYVEAQVHYANGETARYNNAVSLWNNGFLTYRDYYCRREMPEGQAKALRLC